MKSKKEIIKWIRMIAFLLAFVCLLGIFSHIVFSPERGTLYFNKAKHSDQSTNKNDTEIQVFGVGNSDLYSAFDPNYLWQNFGYTSYVSASPRQTPYDSYISLLQMLKIQSPQVAIIETDMIYTNDLDETQNYDWRQVMSDYCASDFMDVYAKNTFPLFYYHDKWKSIADQKSNEPFTHGYVYLEKTVKVDPQNYMQKNDNKEELAVVNKDYISKIINICRKNNIYPLFVEVPSPSSWNYQRHNAVQEFANELDVEFIDFNLITDDIGFDFNSHFRDNGNHLNYQGSCLITNYLGDYISKKVDLQDRRTDPNFIFWNENAEKFNQYRNNQLKKQKGEE